MIPEWCSKYIGIPYLEGGRTPEEWDCLGMVRWIIKERLGIVLPSYLEKYAEEYDKTEIMSLMLGEAAIKGIEILPGQEREMDVALFRGCPIHVGLVVDFGEMLNVQRGSNTAIVRYYGTAWRNRLIGFWRRAI